MHFLFELFVTFHLDTPPSGALVVSVDSGVYQYMWLLVGYLQYLNSYKPIYYDFLILLFWVKIRIILGPRKYLFDKHITHFGCK